VKGWSAGGATGPDLSVIRLPCSYGRWWEARSAIGRMFNWPRILVRLSIAWIPEEEEHIVRAVARWAAVLAASTFAYISGDDAYYVHVEDTLSSEVCYAVPSLLLLFTLQQL
jgi:predicted membrane chloride channel (bestrophin family)